MEGKTKRRLKRKRNQLIAEEEKTPQGLSFKLIKVAVSQICQSVGYKSVQQSAIDTLSSITAKYIEQVAKLAAWNSQQSNRTESNIFDLINALHGMQNSGIQQNSCLLSSSVLEEISEFVKRVKEIPFAKPIPRNWTATSTLSSSPEIANLRGLHIPEWLPPFPNPSTYKESKEMIPFRRCTSHLWENQVFVQDKENTGRVV